MADGCGNVNPQAEWHLDGENGSILADNSSGVSAVTESQGCSADEMSGIHFISYLYMTFYSRRTFS